MKTTQKKRWPQKWRQPLKNEDALKTEDNLKTEDDLKIVKDHIALPYTAVAVIFKRDIVYWPFNS